MLLFNADPASRTLHGLAFVSSWFIVVASYKSCMGSNQSQALHRLAATRRDGQTAAPLLSAAGTPAYSRLCSRAASTELPCCPCAAVAASSAASSSSRLISSTTRCARCMSSSGTVASSLWGVGWRVGR